MAFERNMLKATGENDDQIDISVVLNQPAVRDYIDTHQNRFSGDGNVVEAELDESLVAQELELGRNPQLLSLVQGHLATIDTMRQAQQEKEAA